MIDPNPALQPDLYDSSPASEMLQARKVALRLFQQMFIKKTPLDQIFDDSQDYAALTQRDRAFVRMIVSTSVRRLGQVDDLIRRALSRPDQVISPPVLENILRLGVAQLVFMNVADHAAVNTSVQLVEAEGHARLKGFVNAVLRKIAHNWQDWTARQDVPRLNTPDWLLKLWIQDYGLKTAIDIAMANLEEAPLDVTVKKGELVPEWSDALQGQILPTGSLRLHNAKMIPDLPGFGDGMWWVQDAAAAIPARLFGNLQGKVVYDLCAAPGGKTAQLASLGAQVVAVDRSAKRLQRLQENMRRLRLSDRVSTEVADAAVWKPRQKADYILLDAPCTATGTIRRHPDVAWLKTASDVRSLSELQERILNNALDMLNPGGVLIYCTCSLQKDEGERQIEAVLQQRADIDRQLINAGEIGGVYDLINPAGDLRILPQHMADVGGMDGFFVSRLVKRRG